MLKIIKRVKGIKSHVGSRDESLLGIAYQVLPYYFRRDGFSFPPKIIFLSINSVCNLRCKMCDVGQKDRESYFYKNLVTDGSAQLSLEIIQRLIDEVKDFKPLISITSTEPLLHKDITKICKYAIDNDVKIQITTNGYLLEKFAEAFVDIGLHRLTVSLDGPPEIHDDIRGVKGAFERALNGLRKIDDLKHRKNLKSPELYTSCVISNYNYFALVDTLNQFERIDIEKNIFAHITFITPEMAELHNSQFGDKYKITPSSLGPGIDPSKVDLKVLNEQIERLKKEFPGQCLFSPVTDYSDLEIYYRKPEVFLNSKRCFIPWTVSQIIANGDVIPMTRCFNKSMGNIYESSFAEIWNGELMRDFRRDLMKYKVFPACSRCRGVL